MCLMIHAPNEDSNKPAHRKLSKTVHSFKCPSKFIRLSGRVQVRNITKTCLYNFDHLTPHVYIVKLWFRGGYIFFYFSSKHKLWYSLEPPRRGGSNEYPHYRFWAEIWKISEFFIWKKKIQLLEVKFSIYLNMRVFVMVLALVLSWIPAHVGTYSYVHCTGIHGKTFAITLHFIKQPWNNI